MATPNCQPGAHQPQRDDGARSHLEIAPEERLTCIHQRIHYTDTRDTTGEHDELGKIQIEIFLNTLAEVAQAVARRKLDRECDEGQLAQ